MTSKLKLEKYEHLEYTPYGELWVEDTQDVYQTPFRFTSKEWDEETELYYYGARYMHPRNSTWVSADPAGFELVNPMEDGKPKQGYSLIESTNWYTYTSNNPIKYVDPTGLKIEWIQGEGTSDENFEKAKELGDEIKNSDTEAGKRWRAAEESDKTVKIYVNDNKKNDATPGNNDDLDTEEALKSILGGGDAFINFDPNTSGDLKDGAPRDVETTLAHEMAHAYLMIEGRNPITRKGRERDACAVDNQYRDSKNIDQRNLYGAGVEGYNWPLPQYNRNTGSYSMYGSGRKYRLRGVK